MNRYVWAAFFDELEKLGMKMPPIQAPAIPAKGFSPAYLNSPIVPVPNTQKLYIGDSAIPINKARGISPYGPAAMV